jgi:hypothetical protein
MVIDTSLAAFLAHAVLLLHVAVATFVVGGLIAVVVGNVGHWRNQRNSRWQWWINALWFRLAHLLAIAVIVAETWLGVVCPLTTLEMWLRDHSGGDSYRRGFVEHWLRQLLYFDAPPWVFGLGYTVFAVLVLTSWWVFPPRSKPR